MTSGFFLQMATTSATVNSTMFAIKMRDCRFGYSFKVTSKERFRDSYIVERVILPKGNGLQALGFRDTMINRGFVEYIIKHLRNKQYLECKDCKKQYGRGFCRQMRRLARDNLFDNFVEKVLDVFIDLCSHCRPLYHILWIEEDSYIVLCLVTNDFEDSDTEATDSEINAGILTLSQNYTCQDRCLTKFCDKLQLLWNRGFI